MLDLDLIGSTVTLSDSDARVLLQAAEADSGSSIGSRDIASRLKAAADPATRTRRRQLMFTRSESRALQRLIQAQIGPTGELDDLRSLLSTLLGAGRSQ
jgi:hypothetical protein